MAVCSNYSRIAYCRSTYDVEQLVSFRPLYLLENVHPNVPKLNQFFYLNCSIFSAKRCLEWTSFA